MYQESFCMREITLNSSLEWVSRFDAMIDGRRCCLPEQRWVLVDEWTHADIAEYRYSCDTW